MRNAVIVRHPKMATSGQFVKNIKYMYIKYCASKMTTSGYFVKKKFKGRSLILISNGNKCDLIFGQCTRSSFLMILFELKLIFSGPFHFWILTISIKICYIYIWSIPFLSRYWQGRLVSKLLHCSSFLNSSMKLCYVNFLFKNHRVQNVGVYLYWI